MRKLLYVIGLLLAAGPASAQYALEGPVWATTNLTWNVDPTNAGSDPAILTALATAFNNWHAATGITFTQIAFPAPSGTSADIHVAFANLARYGDLGLTSYSVDSNNHFIPGSEQSFIESPLNSPVVGGMFTQYRVSLNTAFEHEIGHALGLAESPDGSSVMYKTATTQTIVASDIAGINAMYPSLLTSSVPTRAPAGR